MQYVGVLVADASYHGTEALTYASKKELSIGSLVYVPLRAKKVLGIVVSGSTKQPAFATKSILEAPDLPPLPNHFLPLLKWICSYYQAHLGVAVQQFLPRDLPKKESAALPGTITWNPPAHPLTNDQAQALKSIGSKGLHLLHGDTGTGKTRVYIELAKRAIDRGTSVMILTPEIGLTSQLADTFRQAFGERVIVIHSQLTEATRRKLWATILKEIKPLVVIGPRSVLFTPLHNLGLIVVDEAHETAYKQDKSPYYLATHVASKLASLQEVPVVLGSATPSVKDYFVAEQKQLPIIRMTATATSESHGESQLRIIDLRDHTQFTKKSYLSDVLIADIRDTLQRKEQALLFLNRRGTARIIMCDNCGWQALCPHCDLPTVYHNDTHTIRCHSCNFYTNPPTSCPECHNASVIFKSIGTKAVTEEVQRLFPETKIKRFDTDNKKAERIEQHYDAVKSGEVDILIGTQTLAKGLDLPQLSLVGVVIADTSLYMPDFSAQERTFQLLSQVIGRVGRGHRKSKVVIQTYSPESPIMKAIAQKDWNSFYQKELAERKQFLFPPFCFMLKIWCRRATRESAQRTATSLAQQLQKSGLKILVEGPAPAFHEKTDGKYQWQLIIKAKQRNELIRVINLLPSGWSHDIDPLNLL